MFTQLKVVKLAFFFLLNVAFVITYHFKFSVTGLNFGNNACSHLESYRLWFVSPQCWADPDVLSNVPSMTKRHGYKSETHKVITVDGYILKVYRVLPKNHCNETTPVFIQHGIATDSGVWVDVDERSLAFFLADMCYDVWLGNVRGSTWSDKNVKISKWKSDFWNFTLDDIAKKDISSMLHLVASKTGNLGNIIYIGHSMGATVGFMYCSAYFEEASSLIQGIVALAPIVYLDDLMFFKNSTPTLDALLDLLITLRIKGLFYQEDIIHSSLTILCRFIPEKCRKVLDMMFGKTCQFPSWDLLVFYSYWPGGTSAYQFKQYLQIYQSNRFQFYDYGEEENRKLYNSSIPPLYNLTNCQVPVQLYYGKADVFYNQKNIDRLYDELGSGDKYQEPISNDDNHHHCDFDHIDFMYAEDIRKVLYTKLAKVLKTLF